MPKEVKVACDPARVEVTGPKGLLTYPLPQGISVSVNEGKILVHRGDDQRTTRALQGLTRSLIANMVTGVTKGFEKKLEIVGVGFRADLQGNTLKLALGYSHPILYPVPKGIQVEVDKQTLTHRPGRTILLDRFRALKVLFQGHVYCYALHARGLPSL